MSNKVPKDYIKNYPEGYQADRYQADSYRADTVTNRELKELAIRNSELIKSWQSDTSTIKESIAKLQEDITKIQINYTEIKSDIKNFNNNAEWFTEENAKTLEKIDAIQKISDTCPICNGTIDIEETIKLRNDCRSERTRDLTSLSEKVQSLAKDIKEMKEKQKTDAINAIATTTNRIAIIAIVVSVMSSIIAAVIVKVL